MSASTFIIALTARTPVGWSAEGAAAAVRAGVSRIAAHPFMVDHSGEPICGGFDEGIPSTLFGRNRMMQLVSHGLQTLLPILPPPSFRGSTVPLFMALPEERPGFGWQDCQALTDWMRNQVTGLPHGLVLQPVTRGHAGGLEALHRAHSLIQQRQCELAVVGGVDSYWHADTLDWLQADKRLACAAARGGFPPGEGVAIIAVASGTFCHRLGVPALATVKTVASAQEPQDPNAPSGPLGKTLSALIASAGTCLRRPTERFDDLYCDINDERARTTELGFALLRTGELFRDGTRYVTSVPHTGDLGAASSIFSCVLASRAWARGYAAGPSALVMGTSWTGLRSVALLQHPNALNR